MKIIFVANTGYTLYGFRLNLMKRLFEQGWEIVALASDEANFTAKFNSNGVRFIEIPIDHKGKNPFKDLRCMLKLKRIYEKETPTLVHHFTIKPVIFGSLAAKLAGISSIVNTITGLGYIFTKDTWIRQLVEGLYKIALAGNSKNIFQNRDDYNLFISKGLVSKRQANIILGSGINTREIYPRKSMEALNGRILFVMIARMLWSKGVKEFVTAAESVKKVYSECQFIMAGGFSGAGAFGNPDMVPEEWLHEVNSRGIIRWMGRLPYEEVLLLLDQASVAVLPSYREGVPKSLLEAAAKAKPIITTDAPGCREVVVDGVNGFLVPIKNSVKLAESMIRFIQEPELMAKMGAASRKIAETLFDEEIVFQKTLMVYKEAMNQPVNK